MLHGGQLTLRDVGGKIWYWSLLPGQFIHFEVDSFLGKNQQRHWEQHPRLGFFLEPTQRHTLLLFYRQLLLALFILLSLASWLHNFSARPEELVSSLELRHSGNMALKQTKKNQVVLFLSMAPNPYY